MTTIEDVRRTDHDGLVEIDGEQYYRVSGIDRMPPFLMSVVSDGDRWMFVSSSGALTAGRRDASQALFPYVTDDRLHSAGGATGPVTVIRVESEGHGSIWQPFAALPNERARRSVSKTVASDAVRFEEVHDELGLTFAYRWSSTEEFGFVRTATLTNDGSSRVTVDVIDGLVDLLPYGLEPAVYQRLSNLTHAYKRSEIVDADALLAIYNLESPVSDQAEPEEVLRATTVWSTGFDGFLTLGHDAISTFRHGGEPQPRGLVTGVPGAYLRQGRLEIEPGTEATWYIVADVGHDHGDVAALRRRLRDAGDLVGDLESATRRTGTRLAAVMAPADSLQCTADEIACAHHMSNVIYNVMRGGVPLDGYRIDTDDLADFVVARNRAVARRRREWFDGLPDTLPRRDLLAAVSEVGDEHLIRLTQEYLPFSFSRRHGDPSRPWNEFSIRVANEDGDPVRYFEGNWRDVFQNWEALCASFPDYLPGIVSLFVNASTADGYNPYRITREGIDWEVPDPDDPWANIGYWGDHQIVYLLRLLEATEAHQPGLISSRLRDRIYTYADVPYRIASYHDLVADPKNTIEFDELADQRTAIRVDEIGGDGKLVAQSDGTIVVVTLVEKLIVAALAKLSNFVAGGGIWMNTQRPEWNDANNALVGYGLSMVTLFHLRRFIDHLATLVAATPSEESAAEYEISDEVTRWFRAVSNALDRAPVDADDARDRRRLLDDLGTAASDHRATIYGDGFSGATTAVSSDELIRWCDRALTHLDATIRSARRPDGLAHSYNLLRMPDAERVEIDHLPEMLEGQVAALTPGLFTPEQQADMLDALFDSALRRQDLDTFMLAPERRPAAFMDKNVITDEAAEANDLVAALRASDDTSVIDVDADGIVRFAADLTSADHVHERLDELGADAAWSDLVDRCRRDTLALYESVFGHHAHLGRSGTMYGFEGIGSVYWHMVTKLLLAVQEAVEHASRNDAESETVRRLTGAYWRVRDGLGVNTSAEQFGAIPIDPYSHTPAHAGAQQPGMTGAVKEEILARPRELGVHVDDGVVVFDDLLLRTEELLEQPATWRVRAVGGHEHVVELEPGTLGLTLCQVPIVIATTTDDPSIDVEFTDGRTVQFRSDRLDQLTSAALFGRTGEIALIRATVFQP